MRFRFSSIVLETLTIIALAVATGFLVAPRRDSDAIIAVEREAIDFLEALGDAERALIASRPDHRPGFITELEDSLAPEWREGLERHAFLDTRRAGSHFIVVTRRGYCFVVYLVDEDGASMVESGGRLAREKCWIIYAWPEVYGRTGRRLFVLDSFGHSRSWDNPLGHYSGADMPPVAALARSLGPDDHPLKERVSGWEKTIRWDPTVR